MKNLKGLKGLRKCSIVWGLPNLEDINTLVSIYKIAPFSPFFSLFFFSFYFDASKDTKFILKENQDWVLFIKKSKNFVNSIPFGVIANKTIWTIIHPIKLQVFQVPVVAARPFGNLFHHFIQERRIPSRAPLMIYYYLSQMRVTLSYILLICFTYFLIGFDFQSSTSLLLTQDALEKQQKELAIQEEEVSWLIIGPQFSHTHFLFK